MSATSGDKARAAAQALRDQLKAEGRPFDAEIITRLIRTSAGTASTNALLYEDNQRLRAEMEARG